MYFIVVCLGFRVYPSLPYPTCPSTLDYENQLILQELNYDKEVLSLEAAKLVAALNDEQPQIYDKVMMFVENSADGFLFVYGYGGTDKTFLWNILICSIRASGDIVLPVASNGIAATLLP